MIGWSIPTCVCVEQIQFFSFGKATSLGEGKLKTALLHLKLVWLGFMPYQPL